jgi:hypothetical protein
MNRYKEVSFKEMLKSDGEIVCDCWLLSNSVNKYGVDLQTPMMLNEFLRQIGTYLTPMNCSSLFNQSKWYVIDEGF